MKRLAVITATVLIAGTASANLDSVTICNPANKKEGLTLTVANNKMTVTNFAEKKTETQELSVTKTKVATIEELRDVATKTNLKVNLEEGIAYGLAQDAMLIAADKSGVKYLIQIIGPYTQLLGDSNSCK